MIRRWIEVLDETGEIEALCSFEEFYVANRDGLDELELDAIGALKVGETYEIGGGAAPLVTLRQPSPERLAALLELEAWGPVSFALDFVWGVWREQGQLGEGATLELAIADALATVRAWKAAS